MNLSWDEIQGRAAAFAKRWKNGWDEKSEAQSFVRDLLAVFGVEDAAAVGRFEERALRDDGKGFMDYFWRKKIAIEMKTRGRDLERAYSQLVEYLTHLPQDEVPELWMVCDFETIKLFRRSTRQSFEFKTKDLRKYVRNFADIAGYETKRVIEDQAEVNVRAAEKMAQLHDALKEYGYDGHNLEVFLVRLLFCLFADDTEIFARDSFFAYIEASKPDGSDLSGRISQLFEVLNQSEDVRRKRTLLSDELKQFRYINGGLFANTLPGADFNAKMRQTLLDCCGFDWSQISPAIFGAMFQGVMDKERRRELGAHYTSEENILKLINPLFLDDLWLEFEHVKTDPAQLERFHGKLASLKFLDPACGCGNFLIITYRELRRLELEILKMLHNNRQRLLDISQLLRVGVEQFYGIEYEDFPCQIAQVGMWLTDHQMNLRAGEQFGCYYARLPLSRSATIVHGNALRLDWTQIVPANELYYLLGNPPFTGARVMSAAQKDDIKMIFGEVKNVGNLDYVAAWFYTAARIITAAPHIRTAFVATNSITQGEQVAILWKPILEHLGIHIDFGYRTFKWSNEARGKAAVHCVIVGISKIPGVPKFIYDGEEKLSARNINGYLIDAQNIFVESRSKPLFDIPNMIFGNMPNDDGNLILSTEDRNYLTQKYPFISKYIRAFVGAEEFIQHSTKHPVERFCLWLVRADPSEIKRVPEIIQRIEEVRIVRSKSEREATRKKADTPTLFGEIRQPNSDYILIPRVSSEQRKYIPIGFLTAEIIASDATLIIPSATIYHFGILTGSVHNAWMRAVCGRLKSDYRYSKDIVYNNYPWPTPTEAQKAAIEAAAQGVLDARAIFPDCSLADLYDPNTMPPELTKAHKSLDKAVMAAYGFDKEMPEADIVAALMEMYRRLTVRSR